MRIYDWIQNLCKNKGERRLDYRRLVRYLTSSSQGFSLPQKVTLLTVSQNFCPWIVAMSSSSGLGRRAPVEDANVPAPQGEPVEGCG